MTYTILDLFCGGGGAARGYRDAGFQVVGVDIKPQKWYPYEFHQADAIEYLKAMLVYGWSGIDAIHASPPCQRYSVTKNLTGKGETHPDLVGIVRDALIKTGLPWVIENVPGAPLIDPVILCGSHFRLTADIEGFGRVMLKRHRLFESNFPIPDPGSHDHSLPAFSVVGHDVPSHQRKFGNRVLRNETRTSLMGISWMGRGSRDTLGQAIPPAYTEYVGRYLMEYLASFEQVAA